MPDIEIKYNNTTIASLSNSSTEVLETNGKYCEDDIKINYIKPTPNLQSKSASPTTSSRIITADSGFDGLSQVTVNAISPIKSAQTYTPSTTDQTIQSGRWLSGNQTIKGDANLVASNIKKDVQIFGVTGSYEGSGGVTAEENDVNFIDYDGTILYSYSADDFASLAAMPANPSHTGLTAQGWNWTLADAKTYVAAYGKLDIGQMYITSDSKTRLYITLPSSNRLSPYLGLGVNGTADIDWGDGSTHGTLTGSGVTTNQYLQHTYAAPGDYVIAISGTIGFNTAKKILSAAGSASSNIDYASHINKIELGTASIGSAAFSSCFSLKTITIPKNSQTGLPYNCFFSCYNLKHVTIPSGVTELKGYCFKGCNSLSRVSIPKSVVSNDNSPFADCYGLKSLCLTCMTNAIGSNLYSLTFLSIPEGATTFAYSAFTYITALFSVTIPSTVTDLGVSPFSKVNSLGEIHFKPASPPALGSSSVFTYLPTDCKIYVPTGSLSAYTSATNYPSSGTYTYIEE